MRDVIGILDNAGNQIVTYTYDAWGKILSITGSHASTIGQYNPLRYRGYVYDPETNLYYLQSRYYDPELGRFINADTFTSTGQGLLGNNMFAYCNNNPINMVDYNGKITITVGVSGSGTAFLGVTGGMTVTFDEEGMEIQYSYSEPSERSTTTIGLLSAGLAATVQITNKNHASELRGNSTYLGLSYGETGFDVVGDKPVADTECELIGFQVSYALWGCGIDLHVSQTYTGTIKRYSWEDIWKGVKDLFSLFTGR